MYELIILSLLMRNPMTGYLVAKIINDMIGPLAKVSNGRLYPLLTKLEAEGIITEIAGVPGGRHQRTFRITDNGRMRFHQLMLDTTSNPGEYQTLFWLKVPFTGFLSPEERFYLIEHYCNYCQTHIFHLLSEMEDLKREVASKHYMSPAELDATLETFHHYLNHWRLELDDTRQLRVRVKASTDHDGSASTVTPTYPDDEQTTNKKG